MGSPPPSPENLEGYSASATLIPFPRPLPLLRGPIKAGPPDDPSSGPYLLAFKNPRVWAAAYKTSEAQIISQCESGARIGCAISASSKCRPPWWKTILGISSKQDFGERHKCEEREMEACFVAAKERCGDFAKQRCGPAFKDARIEVSGSDMKVVDRKDVSRLISGVCFANEKRYGVGLCGVDKSWGEFRRKYEVTNVRGSDLLRSDEVNIEDYLRRNRIHVGNMVICWNLAVNLDGDNVSLDLISILNSEDLACFISLYMVDASYGVSMFEKLNRDYA